MHPFSIRMALSLCVVAAVGAAPARASFVDALVQTPDVGQFHNTLGSGTASESRTGAGYVAQAQTSYGVNKVYAQTGNVSTGQTNAISTWAVDFSLTGAAPNTPVNVRVIIDYDFNISAPDGAANWDIDFASYDTGNSTGNFTEFSYQAYTSIAGDHSFDRAGTGPGDVGGAHAGTLTVDLPYSIQNGLALRIATSGGAGSVATTDAFNTAVVTDILLPEGITWTYGADVSGNPLNVHVVPEPSSLGVLSLCEIALMLRRRRNVIGEGKTTGTESVSVIKPIKTSSGPVAPTMP